MALDLRLQQKMVQQLVMTPQLQQAIKLLQLSHLEMAEALQAELEQNPVLEEPSEGETDGEAAAQAADSGGGNGETAGEVVAADAGEGRDGDGLMGLSPHPDGEAGPAQGDVPEPEQEAIARDITTTVLDDTPTGSTPEPSTPEVDREIDWESYLETYSYSLPATAGRGNDDELPPFEASMSKPLSLHDHLRWQVQMGEFPEEEARIAGMLIEEINEDGYLAKDAAATVAEELEVPLAEVETVISELQTFDPLGVAARDLRECLLIQVKNLAQDVPLVVKVVDLHLANVEKRNLQAIARDLKVPLAEVSEAVKMISSLEPRPGRSFSDKQPQYITPDIYVYKVSDDYAIVLNEDGLPKLRISNYYRNALQRSGGNAKSFIQEKLRSAVWLIRSIHMRQRTIYRVMESILKFQRDFFDKGVSYLKPLVLKDVAEDVGMHESTISRVTSNKYVHTPQGIFELKYFFNSSINRTGGDSIASESVRDHIQRLISQENQDNPYSDQQIVERLKSDGIDIARRTVAKYREMLRIPPSSKRKQLF